MFWDLRFLEVQLSKTVLNALSGLIEDQTTNTHFWASWVQSLLSIGKSLFMALGFIDFPHSLKALLERMRTEELNFRYMAFWVQRINHYCDQVWFSPWISCDFEFCQISWNLDIASSYILCILEVGMSQWVSDIWFFIK